MTNWIFSGFNLLCMVHDIMPLWFSSVCILCECMWSASSSSSSSATGTFAQGVACNWRYDSLLRQFILLQSIKTKTWNTSCFPVSEDVKKLSSQHWEGSTCLALDIPPHIVRIVRYGSMSFAPCTSPPWRWVSDRICSDSVGSGSLGSSLASSSSSSSSSSMLTALENESWFPKLHCNQSLQPLGTLTGATCQGVTWQIKNQTNKRMQLQRGSQFRTQSKVLNSKKNAVPLD